MIKSVEMSSISPAESAHLPFRRRDHKKTSVLTAEGVVMCEGLLRSDNAATALRVYF